MKVSIIGSTHPGYIIPEKDALLFSGHAAGYCYLPSTVESLLNEDQAKTLKRAEGTLESKHHSVFGHIQYNLSIENCPKILAMILNNEKIYNTSEKSARYTKMNPSKEEQFLYDKWIELYKKRIFEVYPNIPKNKIAKLAQENARYLISVFTPATIMEYTVSLEQLNYIIGWCDDYIAKARSDFELKVASILSDFLNAIPSTCYVDTRLRDFKNRRLSLFATRKRQEEFGENYSINYCGTFSQLAQAQRHRTLSYEMTLLEEPKFYTPPIISGTDLETKWQKDISSLANFYPQGMLIHINERGTIENFILKCGERNYGSAQLETVKQTVDTLERYYNATHFSQLHDLIGRSRCQFLPDFYCISPCPLGPTNFSSRKI